MIRTIPVVRTGFIRCETDAFFFATPVAAGANLVFCINRLACVTVPVVAITRLSGEKIFIAGITMPGFDNGSVRTDFIRGIHAFFRRRRFAIGAVTVGVVRAGNGLQMRKFACGTVPGVRAERCSVGIVTRSGTFVAIRAVPVTRCTSFGRTVMRCVFGTIPEVFAGFGGCAALFAFVTPPIVRASVRLGVNPRRAVTLEALSAEPVTVRASLGSASLRYRRNSPREGFCRLRSTSNVCNLFQTRRLDCNLLRHSSGRLCSGRHRS